jgi:phosphatidylinositol alpha-1,6-mannosyltransferase
LVPSKGIEKIIKLMPELEKQIPNLVYIIIGDGEEKNNLEKLVQDLNLEKNVLLLGKKEQSDLPNYYSLADCFVLVPENKEGIDKESFGIVYLEALEFDLPVIAGDVGGVKEIAEKNPKVILVNPENEKEIFENILKILK